MISYRRSLSFCLLHFIQKTHHVLAEKICKGTRQCQEGPEKRPGGLNINKNLTKILSRFTPYWPCYNGGIEKLWNIQLVSFDNEMRARHGEKKMDGRRNRRVSENT